MFVAEGFEPFPEMMPRDYLKNLFEPPKVKERVIREKVEVKSHYRKYTDTEKRSMLKLHQDGYTFA